MTANQDSSLIDGFFGEYRFLSNFWPCVIQYDGRSWPSVEHAYQSAKSHDHEYKTRIMQAATPGDAKRLSRQVQLVHNWLKIRVTVMSYLVRVKFLTYKDLGDRLLETGSAELIEGNYWHDDFWGMIKNSSGEWEGRNHLGRMLMQVRAELSEIRRGPIAQ